MKNRSYCRIITLIFLFSATILAAQTTKEAKIDWDKGIIQSTGTAKLILSEQGIPIDSNSNKKISLNLCRQKALTRAKKSAKMQIKNSAHNILIDPDHSLQYYLDSYPNINLKFNEIIDKEARQINKPKGFHYVESKFVFPINKIFKILPYYFDEKKFPEYNYSHLKTDYDSLIIDARNVEIKKMLLPTIYDGGGLEVFSYKNANGFAAIDKGLISYCYDLQTALKNDKAGNHPFYAIAIKDLKGCPVISIEDAKKLLASTKTKNNLRQGKIIFIIKKSK